VCDHARQIVWLTTQKEGTSARFRIGCEHAPLARARPRRCLSLTRIVQALQEEEPLRRRHLFGSLHQREYRKRYHRHHGRRPASHGQSRVESVIQISRQLLGSEDEDLTFISIPEPISEELQAFTSVLIGAEIPKLNGYVEVWRKNSKCAGNVPGVEIEATWIPPNAITYKRWSCTFLKNGHGYSFAYDLPKSKVTRDDALLKAMIDNTKFN
jgi:hypothetical protein